MKPTNQKHKFAALAATAAMILLAFACGGRKGSSDTTRTERLRNLDESIATFAPSAERDIKRALDNAKDSMEHYELYLRWAKYIILSDKPEKADSCLAQITAFAKRQATLYAHGDTAMLQRANSLLAGAYSCQAATYHNFHRNDSLTIKLYTDAYRLLSASDNKNYMPSTCANLADAYIQTNDLPSAAKWYQRALFLVDSLHMPAQESTTLYLGLAQIYMSLHDYDKALDYYNMTERNFGQMTPSMQAYYVNNLGNFYYYKKDYATALKTFKRLERMLYAKGMQDKFDMYLCRVNLADVYLNADSLAQAQKYINLAEPFFIKYGDRTAIYYCNTIRIGIATKRGQYALANDIARRQPDNSGIPYSMVNVRAEYMQRLYEKTGNYRMAYTTAIASAKYNDSLQHNRENMRAAEIMARFTSDTLRLHNNLAIEHKNAAIERAGASRTAAVAIAVAIALLSAVWWMYSRKKEYENRMKIMDLKLNNVRNRISPHFMFNVLNNKITSSDEDEAGELTRMARLIRTNLDLSSMPCVTLDTEIDFVRQYIEVERYMLGDNFTFGINIADGVDTAATKVPSMFVQILTENAIVHGLKGKDGERRLDIDIRRTQHATTISVADNGPGFAPNALKKKTGLGIISRTIAVTNERNKNKIRFKIENRTDNGGNVCGCKATLTLPDGIKY